MTEQGYNGWSNYPTWNVKLWIDNDQGEQEMWLQEARNNSAYQLANALKDYFEEAAHDRGITSRADCFSDLMTWALQSVNWDEIAKSLKEDAEEIPA